jgi:predicted porin
MTLGAPPLDSSVAATGANGTGSFGDRGAFVELEGGFGKVTAGRQNTGARDIFIAFDPAGAINVAGNLMSSTGNDSGNPAAYSTTVATANTGSHGAFANAIKYTTPTFKGVTAAGSFTKSNVNYSNTAADTRSAQGYSYGANYVNGPLAAGVSYANAVTTAVATAGTSTTLAADLTTKTTAAGASYDLGMAKLFVSHVKLNQVDEVAPTATTGFNIQRKSTTYGVSAPVTGALTAFASMGKGTLQFGNALERDLKASQYGVNYALSKRSIAKFTIGNTKSGTDTAGQETKVKETALSLVHSF